MSRSLRKKPRISYYEPDEPNLDEYIFCSDCKDYVYEYCSIHGALLVVPDDVVPAITKFPSYVPRSALTIPHVFLHLAFSYIPDAGLGVFSTLTLPAGVRFGPYRGERTQNIDSNYCWQIYDSNRKPSHVIDARDPNKSNWMRYVNCARHWHEQNLLAFQYQGEIYYKTLKIIPRHTELLVYYGSEFANRLGIDIRRYNAPKHFHLKMGAPVTVSEDTNNNCINEIEDVPRVEVSQEVTENNAKVDEIVVTDCISKQKTTNETKGDIPKKDKVLNKTNTALKILEQEKSVSVTYICDHCQQKFTTKIKLQQHISIHYRVSQVNITCQTCYFKGDTVQALEKHSRLHDEKRRFKCNSCTYRFSSNNDLMRHVRTHTGEKPCKCDFCDYASSYSSNLKKHNMRKHTGDKPYKCDFCDYASKFSHYLKRHMRKHTGEKPYKCDFCDYASNFSNALKRHMRKHTGEKPYKCDFCDYASSFSNALKGHKRKHTGETYKCDFCDYASNFSQNLKGHMRKHTGEKPYKCDLCDYASSRNELLIKHKKRHHSAS